MSVVLACPIGMERSKPFPIIIRGPQLGGEYFSVFSSSLMSQPMSLEKTILMMFMVQCVLLMEVGSREGEFGTPLA